MVESFAAPIYDKFGKQALSNVDEWGCKQLDKVNRIECNRMIFIIYSWKKNIHRMLVQNKKKKTMKIIIKMRMMLIPL